MLTTHNIDTSNNNPPTKWSMELFIKIKI